MSKFLYNFVFENEISMIHVEKAIELIENSISATKPKKLALENVVGCVVAEDIFSPINMPPYRQSAMDGYAIKLDNTSEYKVIGESKAGKNIDLINKEKEAVRIFTGAMVPEGADTVVVQEHVTRSEDSIQIDKLPQQGANIRQIGEQVKQGDIVLAKGSIMNEASIGFLAGLGITNISVYRKPKVCIITTGDELVKPGNKLKPGKVFESNTVMLQTALKRIGIRKVKTYKVKDTLNDTKTLVKRGLAAFDVVLISGGISVGDYDFVKESLSANGVEEIFYSINQKPGKPLYFGKKDKNLVFGLPGNPASSLTCFYMYVIPAIRKMMGYKHIHLTRNKAKAASEINNQSGKSLFLKARVENDVVTVLEGQSSSMLKSFAQSNVLAYIPSDKTNIKEGEQVECLSLIF